MKGQPDLSDEELERLAGLLGQWADTHAGKVDGRLRDAAGQIIHEIDLELEGE